MHHQTTNAPYNLTTEHGRAQSHAHSAQGAFLAQQIETGVNNVLNGLCEEVLELIFKEKEKLSPEVLTEFQLDQHFHIFHNELGVRDRAVFNSLLTGYRDERQLLVQQIQILADIVRTIEKKLEALNGEE